MNGDIFFFFLLIVALTLHGTEASCAVRGQCETICRERGREGRNCCFGTQGGYGRGHVTGSKGKNYDRACRRGRCDLSWIDKYVVALSIIKKFLKLLIFIFPFDIVTIDFRPSLPSISYFLESVWSDTNFQFNLMSLYYQQQHGHGLSEQCIHF